MKAQIKDIDIFEKITSYFNKLESEEDKWGTAVASHARVAARALGIIKDADIEKVTTCSTYEHNIVVVFTADHVVVIRNAYGECVHTRVTVGDEAFNVTDRDKFVVF